MPVFCKPATWPPARTSSQSEELESSDSDWSFNSESSPGSQARFSRRRRYTPLKAQQNPSKLKHVHYPPNAHTMNYNTLTGSNSSTDFYEPTLNNPPQRTFNNPNAVISSPNELAFILNLSMPAVLQNPHVYQLHREHRENAANAATAMARVTEENYRLKEQIRLLESQSSSHPRAFSFDLGNNSSDSLPSQPSSSLLNAPQNRSFPSSRAVTPLGFSTDIEAPSVPRCPLALYPEVRRPAYPPSGAHANIFWNKDDAQAVLGTASNRYRFNVQKALFNSDGTLITKRQWRSINTTAELVASELHEECRVLGQARSIRYFNAHHEKELTGALSKLEKEQPILSYCASHWKAHNVLTRVLANRSEKDKGKKARAGTSDDADPEYDQSDIELAEATLPPTYETSKKRPGDQDAGASQVAKKLKSSTDATQGKGVSAPEHHTGMSILGTAPQDPYSDDAPIRPNWQQLADMIRNEHPEHSVLANSLFPAIENSDSAFDSGLPSEELKTFLAHLQAAVPDSSYCKDDLGEGWGHYQFTKCSGNLGSVLLSWKSVGNKGIAAELIAVALKTARIARKYCSILNLTPNSYLADIYLDKTLDAVKGAWEAAGAEFARRDAEAVASGAVAANAKDTDDCSDSTNPNDSNDTAGIEQDDLSSLLQDLTLVQLKTIVSKLDSSQKLGGKTKSKLASLILSSINQLTPELIAAIRGFAGDVASTKTKGKSKATPRT